MRGITGGNCNNIDEFQIIVLDAALGLVNATACSWATDIVEVCCNSVAKVCRQAGNKLLAELLAAFDEHIGSFCEGLEHLLFVSIKTASLS